MWGKKFVFFFPMNSNCSGIIHWRNYLFLTVHSKSCAKFLLCSTTWIGPLASLYWIKRIYWHNASVGFSVLTEMLDLVCHLPEKHWAISGPFFLKFRDSVCVLTSSCNPYPCLCSYSGFWVKVTSHPGLPRREVSQKQDFKCKKMGQSPADWSGPGGYLSSFTSSFSFLPCWVLYCLKLVLSPCSSIIFILNSCLLSTYFVRGCVKHFHIGYLTE